MTGANLPLIDRAFGLSLIGNQTDLYDRFLHAFVAEPSFAELTRALEAGDAGSAFLHAHTLKGLCAQLGLSALGEEASAVCELLRGANALLPEACARLPRLRALHEATCRAISDEDK